MSLTGGTASALLVGTGSAPYAYVTDATGNVVDFAGKDSANTTVVAGATGLPALYSSLTGTGTVSQNGGTYATPVLDFVNNGVTGVRLGNSTALVVTNGLRFNANRGGDWFIDTASAGRVLSTGAILVTANVGPYNVNASGAGGIRQPTSGGDLILAQDNPAGVLNVSTTITTGSGSSATNLVKTGRGTLLLGGVNTYTGQTYLDAGVTAITAYSGLGGGTAPASLATVNLAGGTLLGNAATVSTDFSSTVLRNVFLTATGGGLAAATNTTLTVGGFVSGSGPLTIGTGTVAGTGAGTANTTPIVGNGTVSLTNGNAFTGGVVLNAGTLQINGQFAVGGSVYGGTRFNGGTLRFTNVTGTNGSTDVSTNSLGVPQTVTFAAGGATVDTNGYAVTFAATVGNNGTGSLTKIGAGSLTLSNVNSYTGGTNVSAGTVVANGRATALGTGTTAVNAGGVLAGAGSTGGPVVVNSGGTITAGTGNAPANAVGVLSTAVQTWNTNGSYAVKVAGDGTALGTTNDKLIMAGLTVAATNGSGSQFVVTPVGVGGGTITLTSGLSLLIATDTDTSVANPFAAALAAGSLTLATTATVVPTTGETLALTTLQDAGGYELYLVAAPEPTSLLLLATAAAPLALGRRRRRTA